MAKPIDWIPVVPDAIASLKASIEPVVDRAALEKLLKVHRRTAIRLLHHFGGQQWGKTLLIDRQKLISELELFLPASRSALAACTPSQIRRLHHEGDRYRFPDVRTSDQRSASQLPAAIQVSPGRVAVEVADLRDLCAQLWILLETCKEDWEGVERLLEPWS